MSKRENTNALGDVAEGIGESDTKLVEAIVKYLNTNPVAEANYELPLDEGVLLTLRRKIS